MKKIFTLVILLSSLIGFQSQACTGGFVRINKTDSLAADGLYGPKGLTISMSDMLKDLRETGRAVYTMDVDGLKTHRVEYLGSVSDRGGIIMSSYIVIDLNTKEERVYKVKSNYQGNGMTAKGVDSSALKLQGFLSLHEASCR